MGDSANAEPTGQAPKNPGNSRIRLTSTRARERYRSPRVRAVREKVGRNAQSLRPSVGPERSSYVWLSAGAMWRAGGDVLWTNLDGNRDTAAISRGGGRDDHCAIRRDG